MSVYDTKAQQEEVLGQPLERSLSDAGELLQLYKKQKKLIENEAVTRTVGLEAGSVRAVELYSMRPREIDLEYTIEVTMEVPISNGDRKCIKQKYDIVMDKSIPSSLATNMKSAVKTSPFVSHATEQVAYTDEISVKEQNKIKEVLSLLLAKDQAFFKNYERSWLKGYEQWVKFLTQAPAFYKQIKIDERAYRENYSLNLSPYGLEDETIRWDMDQISFHIGPATTKDFKYVCVNIPAEVLRDYHNKLYYNYEYLVTLNKEAVTSIKFIKKEPL
ncbi:MAG: hypothetical protein ACLTBU_01715 [Zhenhengia sp.]|uniref:hypothetical protein n=1 Tax=Zhenhengia sp. TaxID=2944208 RepID=UPI003993CC1C